MPTWYTADIKDGIEFKTYAMNCARAFGACVELRDEPGGGDRIPDAFEPSGYHLKAVEKAHGELAALEAMTPAELERAAARAWDDAETSRLMRLEGYRKQRKAYEAMLAKVNAWAPPTPDHAGLHEFMRTQIEQSIDFDCNESYCSEPTVRLTGESWAAAERARCLRDVQHHEKEHAGEVSRAATRTEWVRALRAAL
jgi:hypothetical protein